MSESILHYPTINIQDGAWLRSAALYWDEVCSIVPDEDYTGISPELLYLKERGYYRPIYPKDIFLLGDPHEFTQAVIKNAISSFQNCVYWCICNEVGREGTPHTHVYLVFENAVMFSTIQKRFYGAHIEPAKGSNQENRDYVRKDGKWAESEKRETNLPETFEESGELPPEPEQRQKYNEAVLTMLQSGATNAEIIQELPTAINHLPHIERARQALLEERFRTTWRPLVVYYIWGETGIGKTRSVMEKYGYENVYRVTNYTHPFDQYQGQDVILFDEFRSSLPLSDMLTYLDGYPVMLPCRYADKVACFTKVYVVSNLAFEEQYPVMQLEQPASWAAFKRRFQSITRKLPDNPDGLPL